MSDLTTPQDSSRVPAVTAEIAKAGIKLELTKAEMNIQAVLDKANALVFNDDNIDTIKDTINAMKDIQKRIDDAHKKGKEPYLRAGDAWDDAKNDLKALIAPTLMLVDNKHTILCQAAEKRKRENDAKVKRDKDIQDKINTTILNFSQEITSAKTTKELVSIQNKINAEQGLKTTYFEFLPTLVERCTELNPLLKDQKEAVKKLEELEMKKEAAIATNNDELLEQVENEKEEVGAKISENKVKVEERAINSVVSYGGGGGYTQTFPSVKTARRLWKTELVDDKEAVKKDFDLLEIKLNPDLAKVKLKTLQDTGILKDGEKEDITINGVRYFREYKY